MAALCALVVGGLALVAGALRLGFIAQLLSRPVLSGYLAGVAVIMISGQLGRLLGVTVEGDNPLAQIASAIRGADGLNAATLVISLAVIVTLLVGTRLAPKLPWPLLAVLGATALTVFLGLEEAGVNVVGEIPSGLPPLSLPTHWDLLPQILGPALGIALVAFADNSLDGRAFADDGEELDADAELIALGVSNVGASLTSGFPLSSSSSRTALAKVSGARTPAYGWVTAVSVVLVLLVAGPVLESFPMAALGGLVVFAALKIVDVQEFRWLWNFRRSEFVAGDRRWSRRAHPGPARGHRVRHRAVRRGHAGPGRTPACSHSGQGAGPGRHARHRRPRTPRRSRGSWSSGTTRRCSSPTPRTSA